MKAKDRVRVWTRRRWKLVVPALVAFAIGTIWLAALTAGPEQEVVERKTTRSMPGWAVPLIVVGALAGVGAILTVADVSGSKPANRRQRIEKMTESLKEALSVVDEIRLEIELGNATLRQLEQDTEVQSQLAKLSGEEARAVLAEIRGTLRNETKWSTKVQLLAGLCFFIAGGVLSWFLTVRFG